MSIKLNRNKKKNILLSLFYKIQLILPFSKQFQFKLFLNLEWIFDRLAHEMSYKIYNHTNHPSRKFSFDFILRHINNDSIVLDLGSNKGEISYAISQQAKEVVGIDYDSNLIEFAKKKFNNNNLTFIDMEAREYLNNNPKNFNTLILSHILEHLDNPKEFILSIRNKFNFIYIEVPDFEKSYNNLYRKELNLDLIYTDNDHVTEFDRADLKSILNECGLAIFDEEYRFGLIKIWCKIN